MNKKNGSIPWVGIRGGNKEVQLGEKNQGWKSWGKMDWGKQGVKRVYKKTIN